MEKILLNLQNVHKGYGVEGTHAFRPVLKGLNLKLEPGQRVGIVGPSGCGKSTLLNMMGALDRPDQGTILFDGREISGFSDPELARFRNLELGFVFQQHHLLPQLTLMENVLLPLLPVKKRISAEDKNWAEELLKQTGIWEQRDQKPGEMSGGECQRAAVVRALINKPKLILADEPTGALDEENAAILADLLIGLSRKEGITLVSVTHAPEFAGRMDIVYQMQNGQLTILA